MASIHVDEPVSENEQTRTVSSSNEPISQQQQPNEIPEQQAPLPAGQTPSLTNRIKNFVSSPSKGIVLLLLIFVLSFGGYALKSSSDKRALQEKLASLEQPTDATDNEAQILKEKIGKFIELPIDEVPTVATVVDAEKVRGQSFFLKAQNNDKVLLFANAGKAILYRPSSNKIIEVAPINLAQNQAQSGDGTQTETTPAQ